MGLVQAPKPAPSSWQRKLTPDSLSEKLSVALREVLGSAGPEHRPGPIDLELEPGRRYLINVGSVGQPRDRDPRAAYAIWDAELGTVAVRRVSYDVATAREKILSGGLPRFLADRLAWGS